MADIIEIKTQGIKETLAKMAELIQAGKDVRPIWNDWIIEAKKYYKDNYKYQGAPYGSRWPGLWGPYRNYKREKTGSGKSDLIWSGTLFRAVSGGKYWYQNIQKSSIKYGIKGLPYANIQQQGGTIQKTPRMIGYFWYRYINSKPLKNGKPSAENKMWLYMAISKTKTITIKPKPYMAQLNGQLPGQLYQLLKDSTNEYIKNQAGK